MAGQPLFRKLSRQIEQNGGAPAIFDRIANGEYVTRIAQSYNVSPAMIYKWIHDLPERETAWKEAQAVSAHSHVEGGLERLERLANAGDTVTSAQVAAEKALAEYRYKVAVARNREAYGEQAKTNVLVNYGELHLQALNQRGHMDAVREAQQPKALPADYEIVEETE